MTEFFVQTEESVKIRKCDLEGFKTMEGLDPDAPAPGPSDLPHQELMPGVPQQDGGSVPAPMVAETKDNLDKFVESLHKKASAATVWVTSLEPPNLEKPNDKQKAFLACSCHSFSNPQDCT